VLVPVSVLISLVFFLSKQKSRLRYPLMGTRSRLLWGFIGFMTLLESSVRLTTETWRLLLKRTLLWIRVALDLQPSWWNGGCSLVQLRDPRGGYP
jgi:hypothetical protein